MTWHNALLYVANACVPLRSVQPKGKQVDSQDAEHGGGSSSSKLVEDPHRRAWFLACIDGYRALAPQFGIVNSIVQGLLGMAVQGGLLSIAEGRALMTRVKRDARRSSQLGHQQAGDRSRYADLPDPAGLVDTRSFVVDLNTAAVDPNAASIQVLTRTFDEMAMFDEFTTEGPSTEQN